MGYSVVVDFPRTRRLGAGVAGVARLGGGEPGEHGVELFAGRGAFLGGLAADLGEFGAQLLRGSPVVAGAAFGGGLVGLARVRAVAASVASRRAVSAACSAALARSSAAVTRSSEAAVTSARASKNSSNSLNSSNVGSRHPRYIATSRTCSGPGLRPPPVGPQHTRIDPELVGQPPRTPPG